MSQEPRTAQGRSTVAYIRGVVFSLLADPADRVQAERCMVEIERRVRLTEEGAVMEGLKETSETATAPR